MPTDRYRLYHVEKAKGGLAMTMTAGSAVVAEDSPPAFGNLHAYDDEIVPWIRRMTDEIHEHGAACMIQLTHLGRRTGWAQDDWLPVVAPSPLREPAHRAVPKEAEDWDIDRIVGKYADAAERMQAGGMDGIEIESYGHLFDQFWSPLTNQRTDEYGGSFENRLRFGWRCSPAIRERVGPDFIVGIRMAVDETVPGGIDRRPGWRSSPAWRPTGWSTSSTSSAATSPTTRADQGDPDPRHAVGAAPRLRRAGAGVDVARRAPRLQGRRRGDGAHAIREGKVDLVGMTGPTSPTRTSCARSSRAGRPRSGRASARRTASTGSTSSARRCASTTRRRAARQTMPHEIPRAPTRGGSSSSAPARPGSRRRGGRRARSRRHGARGDAVGRRSDPAGRAQPRRKDLLGIVEWRVSELARLGVDVRYDVLAEGADVTALDPDVVIVATGGLPQLPDIEEGGERMVTSWDVLGGDVTPTGDVLFFDDNGTHSALSAAEMIARSGAGSRSSRPSGCWASRSAGMNHVPYARAFNETDTRITLNQRVLAVRPEQGRLCVEVGSDHTPHRASVTSTGWWPTTARPPRRPLLRAQAGVDATSAPSTTAPCWRAGPQSLVTNPDGRFQLFRIGDAVASRNIHAAVYDALRLVKDL